jgi:hypothetical protein
MDPIAVAAAVRRVQEDAIKARDAARAASDTTRTANAPENAPLPNE